MTLTEYLLTQNPNEKVKHTLQGLYAQGGIFKIQPINGGIDVWQKLSAFSQSNNGVMNLMYYFPQPEVYNIYTVDGKTGSVVRSRQVSKNPVNDSSIMLL